MSVEEQLLDSDQISEAGEWGKDIDPAAFKASFKKAKQIRQQIQQKVKKNQKIWSVWEHFLQKINDVDIIMRLFELYQNGVDVFFLEAMMAPFIGFVDGQKPEDIGKTSNYLRWIKSTKQWSWSKSKLNWDDFSKLVFDIVYQFNLWGVKALEWEKGAFEQMLVAIKNELFD